MYDKTEGISNIIEEIQKNIPLAQSIFKKLAENTSDVNGGISRASYGEGENFAHDLISRIAKSLGLDVETDLAGNTYISLTGSKRDEPKFYTGSHLDSQPKAGNYDGAAGVIAGLISLNCIKNLEIKKEHDLVVVAWRAEETSGWFKGHHGGHLGSRSALGRLWANELDKAIHIIDGRSVAQHMLDQGFDPKKIQQGSILDKKDIKGYIELHIEQGPVLEIEDVPLGIVTGIRGNLRARNAYCKGEYTHSGGVPQKLRRDAVLATVELLYRIEEEINKLNHMDRDVVFATGKLYTNSDNHALTKVPGETTFTLDIRSQDTHVLEEMEQKIETLGTQIGYKRGVEFEFYEFSKTKPALMTPLLIEKLVDGSKRLGIKSMKIPSGGGHDATEFSLEGVPTAMIFIRNFNGSHNPSETILMEDFTFGTRLLTWFLATS